MSPKKDPHRYDDMLSLPRPISKNHPPMDPVTRASIFSPFAALTGFDDQIHSARQRRCNRISLSEETLLTLNTRLAALKKHDQVTVTYFMYDPGSDGSGGIAEGRYLEATGDILNIVPAYQTLRVGDALNYVDISFEDIHSIEKLNTETAVHLR